MSRESSPDDLLQAKLELNQVSIHPNESRKDGG